MDQAALRVHRHARPPRHGALRHHRHAAAGVRHAPRRSAPSGVERSSAEDTRVHVGRARRSSSRGCYQRRREKGVALIRRGARVLRRGDVAHRHAAQAVLGTGPGGGDGVGQERKLRLGPDRLRLPRGASPHTRRHRSPETKCPYERSYQKVKHPTLPP